MPRGRRFRRVWKEPHYSKFGPCGFLPEGAAVCLSVDEFEALRLKDLEGNDQKKAAEEMDVSQPTFCRILEAARKKVADAIVNGKEIIIEGGDYVVSEKGVPKRDSSGKGARGNRGRGGCRPIEGRGAGRPRGRRGRQLF